MYRVAIAELEADGVSQFIERMNNPIDPLIDGNGNGNQENAGHIQEQAQPNRQTRQAQPAHTLHKKLDQDTKREDEDKISYN